MTSPIRDLLTEQARQHFVGRQQELARLLENLGDHGPLVTLITGLPGVGKSTLLAAYTQEALRRQARVFSLDARLFEPTAESFLSELEQVAAGPLSRFGSRVVLTIDHYERLRVLDTWLRQEFIPRQDDRVRVVIASRQPATAGWLVEPAWQNLFRTLHLDPLPEADALELLVRRGYSANAARKLNRLARGHPLTLALAAQMNANLVLEQLAQLYLSDAATGEIRAAIEASSVVRRVTHPILTALLPACDAARLYDQLSRLSIFENSHDGLFLHDAVRDPIVTSLRTRDQGAHWTYRHAAWRHLQQETLRVTPSQRGRWTLDLAYLLENPAVREAFFPSGAPSLSVEPAQPDHAIAIIDLLKSHETPPSLPILRRWWRQLPNAFRIVRDARGIAGFYIVLEDSTVPPALAAADPILTLWLDHLRREPLPRGQRAILIRRWLSATDGDRPSAVQAECWLDVKRIYLELRASLRRCYIAVSDLAPYAAAAQSLGFLALPAPPGADHQLAVNEFGPALLDGWLSRLLSRELDCPDTHLLDPGTRQLCIDGQRVNLTNLEFGVLSLLESHGGQAVSRPQLLDEVWGRCFHGGSNVVDVVVRTLRQKLGSQAGRLVTVRGLGYRFER